MKTAVLILCLAFMLGCAPSKGIGSQTWYQNRMQEIETAYSKGEINKAEYLRLKNEADSIRASSAQNSGPNTGIGFSYGVFR